MNQNSYTSWELDHILMEMESRHRRDILLCIHEVLNAMDTTKPSEERSRSARRCMEFAGGGKPPLEVLLLRELLTTQLPCNEPT